jgi:hypothetical protein
MCIIVRSMKNYNTMTSSVVSVCVMKYNCNRFEAI